MKEFRHHISIIVSLSLVLSIQGKSGEGFWFSLFDDSFLCIIPFYLWLLVAAARQFVFLFSIIF